ncbi:hypothetical protein FB451DRAFT_1032003, partial [Mycena latifolia]
YAEIQFFFQTEVDDEDLTLALICRYSPPDPELLRDSFKTLLVCDELHFDEMEVIEVDSILSVVGMIPFDEGRVFVAHRLGLEIAGMVGMEDIDTEDD